MIDARTGTEALLEGAAQIDLYGETSAKSRRSEQRLKQMILVELLRRMHTKQGR